MEHPQVVHLAIEWCAVHDLQSRDVEATFSSCGKAFVTLVAPVAADALPVVQRTFGTSDMLSLWIGLVVCLPSWYLAGSLVEMGAETRCPCCVPSVVTHTQG